MQIPVAEICCTGYNSQPMAQAPLDKWLADNGKTTLWLVGILGCDRTQAWRIRHGHSGTSKERAQKIEEKTGLPWHQFIEPERAA